MKKSPEIKLPDDPRIRERLEVKLAEYRGRLSRLDDGFRDPALLQSTDAGYKVAILERLLQDGVVHTWEFSRELEAKYGIVKPYNFNNAAAVIDDYCRTGGKNTSGGSGF